MKSPKRKLSFRLFRRTSSTKSINNKHASPQRYETESNSGIESDTSVRDERTKKKARFFSFKRLSSNKSKNRKDTSRARQRHEEELETKVTMNNLGPESDSTIAREESTGSNCSVSLHKLINESSNDPLPLSWLNSYPIIPVESEIALLSILLPYGNKERGMMKNHPPRRVEEIIHSCNIHGMKLEQALSLRRYHMMLLNPQIKSITHLGLGNTKDIRDAKYHFIRSVKHHLKECGIPFVTKKEQTTRIKKSEQGETMQSTPDLMLPSPVNLLTNNQPINQDLGVTEGGIINWIDCKMMYGASIAPNGTRSIGGGIPATARKYINNYGPGAIIFLHGCGSTLRAQLRDMDIQVLDSYPLDLTQMLKQKKSWCSDRSGLLLP